MARPPSTQPTDAEWEILTVLWESGPAGLGTIRAAVRQHREVAATTIATMLKIMESKGLVGREEGPRGYLWSARVNRKRMTSGLLRKLLDRAFDGSAGRLVAHLVEEGTLSAKDREAIRRLLEQPGRPRSGKSTEEGPK